MSQPLPPSLIRSVEFNWYFWLSKVVNKQSGDVAVVRYQSFLPFVAGPILARQFPSPFIISRTEGLESHTLASILASLNRIDSIGSKQRVFRNLTAP
jgi:hypothetical protein